MIRPLAVMSAVPQELAALREAADVGPELPVVPGVRSWSGRLDGHDVILAEAGIGKVATAMLATALIVHHRPGLIVFSGVAGGLDPGLDVADVVIADAVVQHDFGVAGVTGIATYQAGHLPFFNPTDALGWAVDPALLASVRDRLAGVELEPLTGRPPRIVHGRLLTGDSFVDDADVRRRLFTRLGGVAVEMEGGALAQVAEAFGVPWLIIRALSDLAGEGASSADTFARFLDVAARNGARVVRHCLPVLVKHAGAQP